MGVACACAHPSLRRARYDGPAVALRPYVGDGTVFIDIVIFALIAAFLVYRLRNVLGRRHGEERQRANPYAATPPARAEQDNVVSLPGRPPAGAEDDVEVVTPDAGAVLAQIGVADPSFDSRHFLNGAKAAFSMVVKAFADGDTATLRPLLSDEIYETFERDIQNRQSAGDTLVTDINSVVAEIIDARLQDRIAFITIRFTSSQTNVVRNAAGEIVDGDPAIPQEVVDIWTFSRDTGSRDPNWLLVETRTP